jgi:hypothetical protein
MMVVTMVVTLCALVLATVVSLAAICLGIGTIIKLRSIDAMLERSRENRAEKPGVARAADE